jgi:hypothetical protein
MVASALNRWASFFDRRTDLAEGSCALVLKGQFGPSSVTLAASALCNRHRDLDLVRSWREYESVPDWGRRWPTDQHKFAAGLVLTPAREPIIERSVGRCLFDLARLGRPLLWGVVSDRIRWHSRFALDWDGWPGNLFPYPTAAYARLIAWEDSAEFCPQFHPILYSADPDFTLSTTTSRPRVVWRDHPPHSVGDDG